MNFRKVLAVPTGTVAMLIKRRFLAFPWQPSLPGPSDGLPKPFDIMLLRLLAFLTHWGPVIQAETKVAMFGKLAK